MSKHGYELAVNIQHGEMVLTREAMFDLADLLFSIKEIEDLSIYHTNLSDKLKLSLIHGKVFSRLGFCKELLEYIDKHSVDFDGTYTAKRAVK